ncbi:MAG: hypothetical protein MZW92_07870 [Comamonadaceae bacterium]|nr:hypothetical protein [Comamonadaceae bacterium]
MDKYSAPQWLGARATRRFHVMAKPAGSACNLDCTYCFYLSKRDAARRTRRRPHGRRGRSSASSRTTSTA